MRPILVFFVFFFLTPWVEDAALCDDRLNISTVQGDLYASINAGAQIYLGQLDTWVAESKLPDPIARGVATIRVTKVISGPEKKVLTLPAPYAVGAGAMLNFLEVWPNLTEVARGQSFLCVIVPGALDPVSGPEPIGDGAASIIAMVKGKEDPLVGSYEQVISLQRLLKDATNDEEYEKVLREHISVKDDIVRRFAMRAAIDAFPKQNPERAVALLLERIETFEKSKKDDSESFQVISGLSAIAVQGGLERSARDQVFKKFLGLLVTSEFSLSMRPIAVGAAGIAGQPGAPAAADVLSGEQVKKLRQVLEKESTNTGPIVRTAIAKIKLWSER